VRAQDALEAELNPLGQEAVAGGGPPPPRLEDGLRTRSGARITNISEASAITFTSGLVTQSAVAREFCSSEVFQRLVHDILNAPDVRLYTDQAVYKKPCPGRTFPFHQVIMIITPAPPTVPSLRPASTQPASQPAKHDCAAAAAAAAAAGQRVWFYRTDSVPDVLGGSRRRHRREWMPLCVPSRTLPTHSDAIVSETMIAPCVYVHDGAGFIPGLHRRGPLDHDFDEANSGWTIPGLRDDDAVCVSVFVLSLLPVLVPFLFRCLLTIVGG
jgi:hypothetical protein